MEKEIRRERKKESEGKTDRRNEKKKCGYKIERKENKRGGRSP